MAVLGLSLTACRSTSQTQVGSLVNLSRSHYGRGYLQDNASLDQKAQAWANHLAAIGTLVHSNLPDGVPYNWRSLGENVGYGPTIAVVHTAYMHSPGHRANILDPRWGYIGTGAAWHGSRVYTVQVFMQL